MATGFGIGNEQLLFLGFKALKFFEGGLFAGCQQAIEAPQYGQRKNDFAVFVTFIRTAQQVADAPNKIGQLAVGFAVHDRCSVVFAMRAEDRIIELNLAFLILPLTA